MENNIQPKILELIDATGKNEPTYVEVYVSEEISEKDARSYLRMLEME